MTEAMPPHAAYVKIKGNFVADFATTTQDALLDGALLLTQPAKGHRAGTDSVLTAAFADVRQGDKVADFGAGVGTVGLILARRVALTAMHLVEVQPDLAELAAQNARTNALANIHVHCLDLGLKGSELKNHGLIRDTFDHIVFNPPFHDVRANQTSPDAARALAHMGDGEVLEVWLRTAATLLHAKGKISFIHRADRLPMIMLAVMKRFGALRVIPVQPKPEAPALRVLVSAQKGSQKPLTLYRPLVMADDLGHYTKEAEAILRFGTRLER